MISEIYLLLEKGFEAVLDGFIVVMVQRFANKNG